MRLLQQLFPEATDDQIIEEAKALLCECGSALRDGGTVIIKPPDLGFRSYKMKFLGTPPAG